MNNKLKKKLDTVFSQYIRLRVTDTNGNCKCVTCGKVDSWKKMHCGHYISRRHLSTRWEEKNCHVQCVKCNVFTEGNKNSYALFLIRTYGQDVLELLEAKKNNLCKMTEFDYQHLIAEYKDKVKIILNNQS